MTRIPLCPEGRGEKWSAPCFVDWHGFLDDWRINGHHVTLPDRLRVFDWRHTIRGGKNGSISELPGRQ